MSTYDWNAADYAQHSRGQQRWAIELIEKLKLSGTERVLDIGCGDGKVTAEIAALVPIGSVIGIDSSRSMVALAKDRYPPARYSNLSFEIMDASRLDFNQRFDVVFSNAALHWIKDHGPVVEGVYRSLRKGGRILLQMGGEGNASDVLSILDDLRCNAQWNTYFEEFEFPFGFLSSEKYGLLLRDAGFTVRRVDLLPKDMVHDGKAAFSGWIRTAWLAYTQCVPDKLRNDFIDAMTDKYLEKFPPGPDGKIHVAMVRIEVAAEKGR